MITIRALGPVSSCTGIAFALDLSTMSIGLSSIVSIALIGLMVPPEEWLSEDLGRSLRVSVMSAKGDTGA